MNRLVLVLALAAAPAVACATDLPVKLKDGASWTQTTVHSRSSTQAGATQSMTATSVIKITYRKEGDGGTLRQDFISFDVDGAKGEQLKQLVAQAQLIYPAVVEVNANLDLTKVRDWDRMRETIFKAMASMGTDAAALQAVRASYDKIDANHAVALFKEEAMVGIGQGLSLEPGVPRPFAGETPNILGGPPIKTSGAIRLESVDTAKGRAIISWSQTLDPGSLAASMKVTMDIMLARMPQDRQAAAKPQLAGLTLERKDQCRFEIDIPTGLALKTECDIGLKAGAQGQVSANREHWTISQTPPDPS